MNYSVDRYDLDDLYDTEFTDSPAERLAALHDRSIIRYRVKTIQCGRVLESEIYPIWNTRGKGARAKKVKKTRAEQAIVNRRHAEKNITRLINTNFTDEDIWGTVTYSDKHFPKTADEAHSNMQKFVRRLRIYAERHKFPPLKYVYVTHLDEQRANHHIVTNFPDRDMFEKLWRHGARRQARRLQSDKFGYTGLAHYMLADPKGKKRYVTSRNLIKPTITVADYKFTRRKANKIAMGEIDPKTTFEKMYTNYRFNDIGIRFSNYVSGAYLYARMVRRN